MSSHQHSQAAGDAPHSAFTTSRLLTGLAIGGAVVGAGIILAPHVLPALGIGSSEMAEEAMFVLHSSADAGGSGLAGVINHALAAVPVIGENLAAGGLFNAAATATIGIGGVLLGNFIEKREDGSKRIKWGNIIKYGALITSALVAMPTVLTALSTGIIFLSTLPVNIHLANNAVKFVEHTLGTAGSMDGVMMGFSGLAAAIPHFLTCGMALLPAGLAVALSGKSKKETAAEIPSPYPDSPIAAEVEIDRPTEIGKPCAAKIKLRHAATGLPLSEDELAVVHTEKLHVFIVDDSLKDYRHIHPQPTGEPGVFACSFTPETSNGYSAWTEVTPLTDNQTYQLKCDLPSATNRHIPPRVRANQSAQRDGMHFEWKSETLRQDAPCIVEVSATDAHGRPVADLEPVMGARAHLVGFSADGRSLVHTHPLEGDPSRLRFHVEPERAGAMQFYLQVRRHGEDIYIPFGQHVLPPERAVERVSAPQQAAASYSI